MQKALIFGGAGLLLALLVFAVIRKDAALYDALSNRMTADNYMGKALAVFVVGGDE